MTATKLAVAAILIIAAIARFWSIGRESYWIDELFTLETSAGNGLAHEDIPAGQWLDPAPPATTDLSAGQGIVGIIRHAPKDTQAPLYFILLNFWRHAMGSSEAAVRSLSAVCSFITVAVIGAIMRQIASSRAAILAMALSAVSGTQIVFAQEARPYAMALLLMLLAALALV